jgi:hypothetical protein
MMQASAIKLKKKPKKKARAKAKAKERSKLFAVQSDVKVSVPTALWMVKRGVGTAPFLMAWKRHRSYVTLELKREP